MDKKDVPSHSFMAISEESTHSWRPMLLGVSCAFFALGLLPEPEICDNEWSEIRTRMLKGSAHLLGLFVWSVKRELLIDGKFGLLQKLDSLQKEIVELKKRRSEAAKANEKVVRIFASREQSWFQDRKNLRQQIDALMNDLGVLKEKKDASIFELSAKLEEAEALLLSKDELIYELELKRQETEEKFIKAETLAEELRGRLQHHSCELSKYRTAFMEMVSSHRQLEADRSRVLMQVQAAKEGLDLVLDQKEQLVLGNQSLSMELVKMHNDLEQKDQILFAMLRKLKLHAAEKEMLLEKLKAWKAKTMQVEIEIERWKAVSESKHRRHSFKKMLPKANAVMEYPKLRSPRTRAEKKYKITMEQNQHHLNIDDSFVEQLKHKDKKLEAFKCHLMSMELESKSFQSRIKGLDHDATQLRQDNMKLERMLLEREAELHSLKEQLVLHCSPKNPRAEKTNAVMEYPKLRSPRTRAEKKYKFAMEQNQHQLNIDDAFVERLKQKDEKLEAFKCHLMGMELESKSFQSRIKGLDHGVTDLRQDNMKLERMLLEREAELHSLREQLVLHCSPKNPHAEKNAKVFETSANEQFHDIIPTPESPKQEITETNVSVFGTEETGYSKDVANAEIVTSVDLCLSNRNNSTWKMDVQSLGISCKVKRLKHQLLVLERSIGKKEYSETNIAHSGGKGFNALMSLLNKQADRYHTLQAKIDDLCKKIYENNHRESTIAKLEDETKRLEPFLEETFHLQRHTVATGQKSTLVQTKISSAFAGANLDMKQFTDGIRTLIQEVQRGIEVQICRIIGELEGTITSHCLRTSKK